MSATGINISKWWTSCSILIEPGNWQLHLDSFAAMLPWLTVYDHTFYARWGPAYLAEMKSLSETAPAVYREFMIGNFVIKRSKHRFNQVPPDQATEWMNRMC